ncbi:hypothetical protein [Actinomadura parmotrematis]|uniref:Uncharacterized protein n=1 Tax=Actinomadura parmotrematis TaxID=2864039 RepID=A0ABS7FXU4_9ACTN|nr:hypothetical protein [Actinomadura parmotrematis]MBW8485131.1 hypothetical protein [Actinomadura parmotrematis]
MDQSFLQHVDATVRAAVAEDPAFGELMPRMMQWSQEAPPTILTAAMMKMGEGVRDAPPNLGSILAVIAGAWVENGAASFPADEAVIARTVANADVCVAFAGAWRGATGEPLPHPSNDQPSQRIVDLLSRALPDPVGAMMAWFAMDRYALAARTMLATAPRVRAGVTDRDDKARRLGAVSEHFENVPFAATLLRVLDGERLLVLDRKSGNGWTVTFGGVSDNFQLHMLLAGALAGRPGGMPGERVDRDVVAYFTDTEPPGKVITTSPWFLYDAHGRRVYNEAAPADVPAVNGTRVLVLDEPRYPHSFPACRMHPMMTASLTVDGRHLPEDLAGWWPHIAPAAE